jgi:hypothetical protein
MKLDNMKLEKVRPGRILDNAPTENFFSLKKGWVHRENFTNLATFVG